MMFMSTGCGISLGLTSQPLVSRFRGFAIGEDETCRLAGKRGKHCCEMLYLIPYPQTRLFEDLKFRDRESVKAFHSIVTSFTSLYASDKLFPPIDLWPFACGTCATKLTEDSIRSP